MLSRVDVSNDTTVVGLRQMSEAKSNVTNVTMVVCNGNNQHQSGNTSNDALAPSQSGNAVSTAIAPSQSVRF
jgi:hypothetical protein